MASKMSPPYPPKNAGLGLTPTTNLDVPICSIFLLLFLVAAAVHMKILKTNAARHQKFIMSGMLFGFSMSRVVTCIMRIVWSVYPTNISVAIASQIFVAAGVILLFLINLVFTSRIVRAYHPGWAWHPFARWSFRVLYISLIGGLISIITATVHSFFTLSPNALRQDRIVQLVVTTYFGVYAFLPVPLLSLRLLLPPSHLVTVPKSRSEAEKFGTGRFRTKIRLVIFSSLLLSFGALFRAGIQYVPRPRDDPAWYHSKACFYLFDFTIDIIVVYLWAIMRVDRRFIVPNGTKVPGDLRKGGPGGLPVRTSGDVVPEQKRTWSRGFAGEFEINSEEEMDGELEDGAGRENRMGDLEAGEKSISSGDMTPESQGSEKDLRVGGQ